MGQRRLSVLGVCFLALTCVACAQKGERVAENRGDGKIAAGAGAALGMEIAPDLDTRIAAYAPVELKVPWELLDENEQKVLEKLYRASKVMDELFIRQVWAGNVDLREKLAATGDAKLKSFFDLNFGPWDRLNENQPFIGTSPKPDGADFYPADMTSAELEAWIAAHPEDKAAFQGNFTVIRRTEEGGLTAVPYSREYAGLLEEAARYMNEAADITGNESLAKYLRSRAAAFMNDDYYQSDMDWMDVKGNLIDLTIGPYEVYEDNMFNYKAAFEAFLCVRDPEESKKLDGLKAYQVKMEKNLPMDDKYKNLSRGRDSPISVVDEIFSAGDTKAGVQTLAFNLPNDERVSEAKGTKKVMLRNICHAKFDRILYPIAERVIAKDQLQYVTFDAYFNHILLHEFSHGLGPGRLVLADGTETTVNLELKNTYSVNEEAKADIVGEYNFYYLIDDGFFDRKLENETAVTFLAGFFRSVRFGTDSAHGGANMVIFNYMKEKGAYRQDPATGLWSVDFAKARGAVEGLSREILTIQALGDFQASTALIEKYGKMGDDVRESLSRLGDVPKDIVPSFEIEKRYAVN